MMGDRLGDGAVGDPHDPHVRVGGVGERVAERLDEEGVRLGLQWERPGLARHADDAPGRRRVAGDVVALAAGRAGRKLRGEARGEQQLEPEGELARGGRVGRVGVEQREVRAEQVEDLRVRLARVEDPADGVAGPRGAVERVRVGAQPGVRRDGLRARDGEQVAAPLVQSEVDPEERLEERRTPLAIAPIRPRIGVYTCRIRSASP